jgi:hypothetical protein
MRPWSPQLKMRPLLSFKKTEMMVDPLQNEVMVALAPTEMTSLLIPSVQNSLKEIRESKSESETAIITLQPDTAR